ncbi:type 2 lanthipeptide synthetase LanM family protein [Porphyrobacter sp. YT40]|uniref:type 2 lanthipeptide synthetase LanM family protein n=1 Tax=Porphyrobacter sp. YT40 TaxID=2547601 RepID=UPI0015E8ADD8|nr:type 2 lanthipeptide synthetase LanM family protein [Porphyrobacter sp. YT40]
MLDLSERAQVLADTDQSASHFSGAKKCDWFTQSYFDGDDADRDRFLGALGLHNPSIIAGLLERDGTVDDSCIKGRPWHPMLGSLHDDDYWQRLNRDETRRRALVESLGVGTALVPVLGEFIRQLSRHLAALALTPGDRDCLQAMAVEYLTSRLQQVSLPSLLMALNIARVERKLEGEDPEARAQDFARGMLNRDRRAVLLARFPSLDRLLGELSSATLGAVREFASRYATDRPALDTLAESSLGPLKSVSFGEGDAHHGGRTVNILEFENGRIVYKPRSLAGDLAFANLLDWLAQRVSPAPVGVPVWDREEYGWARFIAHSSCTNPEEIREAYQRLGVLLAALHCTGASDIHFENLIFDGPQPFAVDLETLFTALPPPVPGADYAASSGRARVDSMLWVGYLPTPTVIEGKRVDLSAAGVFEAQPSPIQAFKWSDIGRDDARLEAIEGELDTRGANPLLGSEVVPAHEHVDDIVQGFAAAYRAIVEGRNELLAGPFAQFARVKVRHVARPTVTYAKLLRASYHPTVARDAAERAMSFASLWSQIKHEPYLASLVAAECRDLQRGDVPHFHYLASETDLHASDGETIANFFEQSGYDRSRERIDAMGEDDLARQCSVIRQAFRSSRLTGGPEQPHHAVQKDPTDAAPDQSAWLAAAGTIGDALAREAFVFRDMPYWFGATNLTAESYGIGVSDSSIYDGVAGIGLFFSELSRHSDAPEVADMARFCLEAIRRSNPDNLGNQVGGFEGHAALAYAEERIRAAIRAPRDDASMAGRLEAIARAAPQDLKIDIIGGAAGALRVAVQLFETYPAEAPAAARACFERLRDAAEYADGAAFWPTAIQPRGLTGFSHGSTGIAAALAHYGIAAGEAEALDLARSALLFEDRTFAADRQTWIDQREGITTSTTWCHGAPGIVLGRMVIREMAGELVDGLSHGIKRGLEEMARHGAGGSHCLCHGSIGNALVFHRAGGGWEDHARHLVAKTLREHQAEGGYRCGIAAFSETPGLMVGRAGIGLGLLQLAFADTPDILSLELRAGHA